ncbi:MAG: SDR family oxidoreductase [Clostridia bacterium]
MKQDWTGRRALITGAGGGIGRAIAVKMSEMGMDVALGGRSEKKLAQSARLCEKNGVVAVVLPGDLLDDQYTQELVGQAASALGGLDVLVNNAGVALSGAFEDVTLEAYDRVMGTNVRAPFVLCQKALAYLRASDCPTIINIGSVVSHRGYLMQSAYAASKHALLGLTKVLAGELYKEGIRVHMISPGGVYTDMARVARPDLASDGLIVPEDIAEIAAFMLVQRGNAVIDEIEVHRVGKPPFGG